MASISTKPTLASWLLAFPSTKLPFWKSGKTEAKDSPACQSLPKDRGTRKYVLSVMLMTPPVLWCGGSIMLWGAFLRQGENSAEMMRRWVELNPGRSWKETFQKLQKCLRTATLTLSSKQELQRNCFTFLWVTMAYSKSRPKSSKVCVAGFKIFIYFSIKSESVWTIWQRTCQNSCVWLSEDEMLKDKRV